MPNTQRKPLPSMTVADFLDWPGDGMGRRFQLVDGEAREIPPGSATRALIHTSTICLVANHLESVDSPFRALSRPPIVPRVRASLNLRYPVLGVTAAPDRRDQFIAPDPVLLIEILTPDNVADTWDNVWCYCTIPSVREIAVIHSTRVLAEILRRGPDGHWPEEPKEIGPDGILTLQSIDFACPLLDVYAQTHLGREETS